MTTHLASLDRPLLPPGVSFAVVERDGRTLFHSEPARNLVENFVQETGNDPWLRALLSAGDSGTVRVTYLGRRSRLHVTPLAGTPLSLIMVLEDGLRATAHLEALSVSAAVFLAWVVLLLGVFAAVELGGSVRMRWLWPDLEHAFTYRPLAIMLSGFAFTLVLQGVLAALHRLPVQASSLLVPAQALAVFVLVVSAPRARRCRPDERRARRLTRGFAWLGLGAAIVWQAGLNVASPQPAAYRTLLGVAQAVCALAAGRYAWRLRRRRSWPAFDGSQTARGYVASIVLGLTVVAVLPGFLIQRESFLESEQRLLRYEQAQLVREFESRAQRIRSELRADSLPAPVAPPGSDSAAFAVPPVLGARLTPDSTWLCDSRSSVLARLFSGIEEYIPFVNDAAVALRRTPSSARGWNWSTCPDGSLLLVVTPARASSGNREPRQSAGIRSGVPSPEQASLVSWLGVIVLLGAGFGLLVSLVLWVARKVFLLDVPASRRERELAVWNGWAGRARSPGLRLLAAEYAGDPTLTEVKEREAAAWDVSRLSPRGVVQTLVDTAAAHYGKVWSALEEDEKLVAARLAAGAVASPGNPRATRHLLTKGIVVREPELRLMNESFAQYIREEVSPATIKEWESEHAASTWQRLRFPILLGLAIVGAFLFVTQRSAFNGVVAILGAAALGTGTVLKVLGAVKLPGQDKG